LSTDAEEEEKKPEVEIKAAEGELRAAFEAEGGGRKEAEAE